MEDFNFERRTGAERIGSIILVMALLGGKFMTGLTRD
jgi:hypothetical protein